ncbi:MAG: helix-turn-helix domain-containing protein [Alphaproteobacteria bacterium]|nr:helix-turn-helix domain-containing protein [Alphaproteobacteria bacterium]
MPTLIRSARQLGNLIQRTRRQRGLNQSQLADLAGLRQEMVSAIERGHDGTKLATLHALLAALDLDLLVDQRNSGPDDMADLF